jgi:hypothetical protein
MRRPQASPYRRMQQTANILEWVVMKCIKFLAWTLQIIITDLVWGKAKYRKHAPYLRFIREKTIVVRPNAPRVIAVQK